MYRNYHFKRGRSSDNNSVLLFSSQDTSSPSEMSLPNFGGNLDQLKRTGHQKEPHIRIPFTDEGMEVVSGSFSFEPMIPSLGKEDAACLHNSLHTYNVETQTSSGGKSDLFFV
jgi:hypothetical protein